MSCRKYNKIQFKRTIVIDIIIVKEISQAFKKEMKVNTNSIWNLYFV